MKSGGLRSCIVVLMASALLAGCRNDGGIQGVVTYQGPDTDKPVVMGDPACAALHPGPIDSNEIAVRNGKLANVFVYVKQGLEGKSFPVPTEKKVIDQRGCLYAPRVLGVQIGQAVELTNSDNTFHTIHALPAANAEFNEPQTQGAPPIVKTFDKPEVMVPIKCNIHPWMTAWIGVLPHPYFAVTGEDGVFSIDKLPPGKYTLAAWHETLGTQTREVTVGRGKTVTVNFDFQAQP
jgi:plastocyanin